MRATEELDPALPSTDPVILLEPGSQGPNAQDNTANPEFLSELNPNAVQYKIGYIGEGGFCAANPDDDWKDRISDYVVTSRLALLLASSDQNLDKVYLTGTFAHCFVWSSGSHEDCTRDLTGGYTAGDSGDASMPPDPTLLPITSTGIPLIDVANSELPASCTIAGTGGQVYPYADCGQPGISTCLRDRGWTAFQQLRASGAIPLDRDPDVIQTIARSLTEPPDNFTDPTAARFGMFTWLENGGVRNATDKCGFAFIPLAPGVNNQEWRVPTAAECGEFGLSSGCSCTRCGGLPNNTQRRTLSAVMENAAPGSPTTCAEILAAHEVAHNFAADHEALSAPPPAGWTLSAGCGAGNQTAFMENSYVGSTCFVPVFSPNLESDVSSCITEPQCQG